MRLRTNIFLWVSLATVVPLTLIALGATAYSEHIHRGDLDRQIAANLNSMVVEIDRRLGYEREVIAALAVSPPMQEYMPVLLAAREHRRAPDFALRTSRFTGFLEELQSVLLENGSIRVLDPQGDTLVKVRNSRRTPASFSGLNPYPYAEPELHDDFLLAELQALPEGEVSYLSLPPSLNDFGSTGLPPMQDAAVPLPGPHGMTTGYLLVNSLGTHIARILELAPRMFNGKLLIVELNPETPSRDRLILYDESRGILFNTPKDPDKKLTGAFGEQLLHADNQSPYGVFTTRNGKSRVYYTEYLPYPNKLVTWLIATRIDSQEITAPFHRIRLGIFLFAAIALVLTLVLTHLGARRIAEPITQLAENLKAYARGKRVALPDQYTPSEIRELKDSFEYMADTMERAQAERDHAEKMMLQSAKLASIGEMAAGIGHEINNPLNNILTLTKLMRRQVQGGDLANDLNSLNEEAHRASEIIKGILNFARQLPPQYTRIHVPSWVDESIALVSQEAKRRGIQIDTETDDGLIIEGDARQLQQVLVNLLLNAIQASDRGDHVVVKARQHSASHATLCVCDEGSGVESAVMEKLFDPFFTTKPIGQGSGLGLSVSLGIVEHHGGKITAENNERGGLTVNVILPLKRSTDHNA
jgi:two-component system NtrC family sensor kinase